MNYSTASMVIDASGRVSVAYGQGYATLRFGERPSGGGAWSVSTAASGWGILARSDAGVLALPFHQYTSLNGPYDLVILMRAGASWTRQVIAQNVGDARSVTDAIVAADGSPWVLLSGFGALSLYH